MALATDMTVYLIADADKDLGLELCKVFLARPKTLVVAAVQSPLDAITRAALSNNRFGNDSELLVIKIDGFDIGSAASAIEDLPKDITRLDVVIASVDLHDRGGLLLTMPLNEPSRHVTPDTAALDALLQACSPLLRRSQNSKSPRFIVLTNEFENNIEVRYSPTLSGEIEHFMRKVYAEEPWLASTIFRPDWTGMDIDQEGGEGSRPRAQTLTLIDLLPRIVEEVDKLQRPDEGRKEES